MLGGTSKAGHSGLRGTPPSLTCTGRYPCERSECLRRQRLCGHSVAEIDPLPSQGQSPASQE